MIVRQSIRLKQTDRTCWTIETHFQLNLTAEPDVELFMNLTIVSIGDLLRSKLKTTVL